MKKTLLVIDYINGIAKTSTCAGYLAAHPEVLANTNALIDAFRQKGEAVYFIRLAFDENYTGLPTHAPSKTILQAQHKFQLGSEEVAFLSELHYQEGDTVFDKKYGDPFHGSGLLSALQQHKVEEVVFTGVATENAILYGAATAMINNFFVTIISDACGATTDEQHRAALSIMKGRSANQIVTTSEFLTTL